MKNSLALMTMSLWIGSTTCPSLLLPSARPRLRVRGRAVLLPLAAA
jgi:hypothetical protein